MTRLRILLTPIALASVMVFDKHAYAYLDPNIGSMIIQSVIAGIAVVSVTVRMYWYRLVAFFKGEKFEMEEDLLADLETEPDEEVE